MAFDYYLKRPPLGFCKPNVYVGQNLKTYSGFLSFFYPTHSSLFPTTFPPPHRWGGACEAQDLRAQPALSYPLGGGGVRGGDWWAWAE